MIKALTYCINIIFLMVITYGVGTVYSTDSLMLKPGDFNYIAGILTSSLIHDSIEHLIYNIAAITIFFAFLIKEKQITKPALDTIIMIAVSNIIIFLIGNREYFYLGSSNLVYALVGYTIAAVIITRKYLLLIPVLLFSSFLITGLLFGGNMSVSYESHYIGALVGLAYYLVKYLTVPKNLEYEQK